jgi:hypothetical protein
MGLLQSPILSPVFFNVYQKVALKSSRKVEEVRSIGDQVAFPDDMLVMSNNQQEVEEIIDDMTALQNK